MKNKILFTLVCLTAVGALSGCGANHAARSWGGTMTVDLPAGEKLQGVTWKDDELWYLTRPMREDEEPEEWTMQEQSNYGIFEGEVIFKESK